jgi:prepilin-type N-terminal cleavage/methylation domain-containing protein
MKWAGNMLLNGQTKMVMPEMMKKGFSLVELIMVAAVLGIMAAIIVPFYRSQSTQAKEAVAKDHLRILRSSIEVYTVQHRGIPPGYEADNPLNTPSSDVFLTQMVTNGNYLKMMPENPFNNIETIRMIGNGESFPADPPEGYGWVYQPATMTIRLNWVGTDADGIRYFDY